MTLALEASEDVRFVPRLSCSNTAQRKVSLDSARFDKIERPVW